MTIQDSYVQGSSVQEPYVLVIDDDKRLCSLLEKYLKSEGCKVQTLVGSRDARTVLSLIQADVIILDIMMPGEDGLSLSRWIRTAYDTPIILLTAVAEFDQKMAGFRIGVDDYLTKPFEPAELLARIHAILRRRRPDRVSEQIHRFGLYHCNTRTQSVTSDEVAPRLSSTEERLIVILSRQAGKPVSRDALAREVLGSDSTRTIDVHIARLRKKIENNVKHPKYLKTVRGHGYVLEPDP